MANNKIGTVIFVMIGIFCIAVYLISIKVDEYNENESAKNHALQIQQEENNRKARLTETSKIPTKTIGKFYDVNSFTGAPRSRATILTDVGIDKVGSPYDSEFKLWFGEIKGQQPYVSTFTQTAMGWSSPCVAFWERGPYIVFKDKSECDRFYQALTKTLSEWRVKYYEIQ